MMEKLINNIINRYMNNIIFEIKETKKNIGNFSCNPNYITISNKIIRRQNKRPNKRPNINYAPRFPQIQKRRMNLQFI